MDRLEAAEGRRAQEGAEAEHKPIMLAEPQLMLTAGDYFVLVSQLTKLKIPKLL